VNKGTRIQQKWDMEYNSGRWDRLENDSLEKSRSALIAMYCNHFFPSGKILDVGCGVGILFDFLNAEQKRNYLGVDASEIAVNKSKKRRNFKALVLNASDFHTDELFDAIVFNEVLYYLDYKQILRKYSSYLTRGGIIIVSTFRVKHPIGRLTGFRIWQTCNQLFSLIEQIKLTGKSQKKALTWDIKIMKLKNSRNRAD
jgi:2-polyprenyl-3-methyl-5-hydroxy-6-metoxy-1,4-benzoquinol methylase